MPNRNLPQAPKHLAPETRRWWRNVVEGFELEEHHRRLLTLAGESWDRCAEARELVAEQGITYMDRFGAPRLNPAAGVERDSRLAYARLLRELDLDGDPLPDPRPPRRGRVS